MTLSIKVDAATRAAIREIEKLEATLVKAAKERGVNMASQRGKAPSKNTPSSGTSKDMRIKGRGKKPGPKPKG